MIIGYYEQSDFYGGRYIKIYQNEYGKYNIEWIWSEEHNYIPEAEKYIKIKESILCSNDFVGLFANKQLETLLKGENDKKIEQLINYINSLNLKKLAKHKNDKKNVDDETDWKLFIELRGEKYYIRGYKKTPKQVDKIIEYIEKIIDEEIIDKEFEMYIDKIAKKIKKDINLFQRLFLLITQNSKIHHWVFCLYIRNNYIYNDNYLMNNAIDPDELSEILLKKVVKIT